MKHPLDLARVSEQDERDAWADMCDAVHGTPAAGHVRSWAVGSDGLAVTVPALPLTLFNRVMGLGLTSAPEPALLDALPARFADAPRGRWAMQPAPGPHEAACSEALRQRGHAPLAQRMAKMARDLRARPQDSVPPAEGLDVAIVDARSAERFASTVVHGMGLPGWFEGWLAVLPGRPGWHCFVASRAGATVAAGAMHVRDGSAWLGMGATLPAHRGGGAQRSLMRARLAAATAMGCAVATTETGAPQPGQPHPSYSNMLACGFERVATRSSWARA